MTTLSTLQLLEALKTAAGKATEGGWHQREPNDDGKLVIVSGAPYHIDVCVIQPWMTHDEPNAAYIALANPENIGRIVDLLEEAVDVLGFYADGYHYRIKDGHVVEFPVPVNGELNIDEKELEIEGGEKARAFLSRVKEG